MALGFVRNPRLAFVVAAAVACVWLNQGPSFARFEVLSAEARSPQRLALRAWMPLAFAYRRSADEELYFAIDNAIRGLPYDKALLRAKRGKASAAFARSPPPDGHWHAPYRDVPFEYPALVIPFILLPALASKTFSSFAVVFGALMGALMLASVHLGILTRPDESRSRTAATWWYAAALFLAQGGLLIQRLDALAAVFLALAGWAAVRRKALPMGLGIGLAAAAKVLPLLALFPMMAADRDAWRSRASWLKLATGLALGLAASLAPMVLLSPSAVGDFVGYHATRGLHIESTYGSLLSIAALATQSPRAVNFTFGSFNLDGPVATAWARASLPILVLAVASLTAWLARRPSLPTEAQRVDEIAYAGLGAIVCIWLFGKVLSPQYMTWGIPLALTVSSRRPAVALGAAMAIAQAYLRGFYDQVVEMRPLGVFALVARLACLVAMAVFILQALHANGHRSRTEPT